LPRSFESSVDARRFYFLGGSNRKRSQIKKSEETKMKKLAMVVAVIAVIALAGAPVVFATTASQGPYTISATVDGSLLLTVQLFKGTTTGPTGSALSAISFGTLKEFTQTSGKTLRSDDTGGMGEVIAMITANSHQAQYTITQTGTALTYGTNTMPTGACTVTPAYATADNGGLAKPAGATVAAGGSWVGARTIYTSEAAPSAMRTIQAHYSITDDPAAGATASVPLNQAAGAYSGTVQITVTT
jgi:hypothetical protein